MKTKGCKRAISRELSRAEFLVEFLQDVALGKRTATARDVNEAKDELDKYLPDPEPEQVTRH
jgi:hypothetical protein